MNEIFTQSPTGIGADALEAHVKAVASQFPNVKTVLIIPPDFTRFHSMAGEITKLLYREFSPRSVVRIIPALGTHMPVSEEERLRMFGSEIPSSCFLIHHWQTDTVQLGQIPPEETARISGGLYSEAIEVEVNHLLVDGGFDVIFPWARLSPTRWSAWPITARICSWALGAGP